MLPRGRHKHPVTPYDAMRVQIARVHNTRHEAIYTCFLIRVLHVGKPRSANMRLALQSLGKTVIFLKTLLYATHNFHKDSQR